MRYPEGTPEHELGRLAGRYGASMLFLMFNYLFVGTVVSILFALINQAVTGNLYTDISTDAGYAFALLRNAVSNYAAPILVFSVLFRDDLNEARSLVPYPKVPCETLLLFLAGGCVARLGGIATNVVSAFLDYLFGIPQPEAAFSDMMSMNVVQFVTFEFFSIIVAPVCEEFIYRHILLRPMRRFGDMQAAVITGLIFGLSHFNFDQFLYTFLFGFSLAVIAIRRNSIVPTIVIHAVNNLLAGLSVYLPETFGNDVVDSVFAALGTISTYFGLFLIIGGFIALIISIVLKLFSFSRPPYLTDSRRFAVIFSHPLILVSIAASLALTFYLLYV